MIILWNKLNIFQHLKSLNDGLKQDYIFNDKFNETKSGTPQGGIISPFTGKYCVAWNGRSIKY